ncbi:MAG: DUF5696 domain-containing protein [Defluviitaleaceae bacterium]|nr:DUF5696 domain-containing protein [Defluviitaleaceae bacterium]
MRKLTLSFWAMVSIIVFTGCVARVRDGGEVIIFGGHDNVPAVAYIQNEYLRMEFLTETAEIVLIDRATGDEWRSTPPGIAQEPTAAAIERFYAQSLFVLYFERRTGAGQPHDAYRFSVRTGRFEHEIIGDMMELRFTVGDIVETFHIPDAIYEERLEEFLGRMERRQRNAVLNEFTPMTINDLPRGMSRSDAVASFPSLEDGRTIYLLNEDVPPFRLERVQDNLREAGYTYEDWLADMAHFNVATQLTQAAFNLIMRFELDRNNMVLTIPMDEITYVPEFMPTQLRVMPYFGAGRSMEDGYLFVPDGSGSILYFDSMRHTHLLYGSDVFGWDEAIVRDAVLHDNRTAFPVFGVYREGATFAGIIEEGASYASIRAHVAGMGSPYSRVHPIFRLLHGVPLDVQGRSNDSMYMHEWGLPNENIVIRYVIPSGDGYVGMAHAYREFLQERYPWLNERVSEPVNAMVEFLGAALSPQHILGFPVMRPYPLTTYNRAAEIMETFYDFGWRNIHVKMRGAHNDSIDHIVPTSLDLISQLGGRRGFDNMINTADRLGFDFYLEADFLKMRGTRMFDGFSPMRDAARQANRERVAHAGHSPTYFGQLGTGSWLADPIILARPEFMIDTAQNFVEEAAGRNVNNIAFRSMASALAGDFNEDNHVTREASMNMRTEFLSGLRENGTGVWLNYGFSFAIPFAGVITGMPLSDQNFAITDNAVPFYQIALHGIVPFAGDALNLAEDNSYHFLRSVESGASLFFSFMDVPTADLLVTRYRRYFANEFERWADVANEVYTRHVANFGHLYNQLITDHRILERDGVTVTVYEDGTRVYVNTMMVDFVTDTGVAVGARSYEVRR